MKIPGDILVRALARCGYRLWSQNDNVHARFADPGATATENLRPLLSALRESKPGALSYLRVTGPVEGFQKQDATFRDRAGKLKPEYYARWERMAKAAQIAILETYTWLDLVSAEEIADFIAYQQLVDEIGEEAGFTEKEKRVLEAAKDIFNATETTHD